MKNCYRLIVVLCAALPTLAQTTSNGMVVNGKENRTVVELNDQLGVKKAKIGGPVVARVIDDILLEGKIVARSGSKLMGHVIAVQQRSRKNPQSILGFTFDKILLKDGNQIPVKVVIHELVAPGAYNFHPEISVPTSGDNRMAVDGNVRGAGGIIMDRRDTIQRVPSPKVTGGVVDGGVTIPLPDANTSGILLASNKREVSLDVGTVMIVEISKSDN